MLPRGTWQCLETFLWLLHVEVEARDGAQSLTVLRAVPTTKTNPALISRRLTLRHQDLEVPPLSVFLAGSVLRKGKQNGPPALDRALCTFMVHSAQPSTG